MEFGCFYYAKNRRYTTEQLETLKWLYAQKRRIERAIRRAPMMPPRWPLEYLAHAERNIKE